MKLFWVEDVHPLALASLFSEADSSRETNLTYQELKAKVDASYVNYYATGWCRALENIGYETENVVMSATLLQKQWLKENGVQKDLSLEEILLLQIKRYRPSILFVSDCCNAKFVQCIKREVPSAKLIIGWAGSAVAKDPARKKLWKMLDIILCCAPESVSVLRQEGGNAVHINHAFPREVISSLCNRATKHSSISFIGSLVRGQDYHLAREQLLLSLVDTLPLRIYSPSACLSKKQLLKSALSIGLYNFVHLFPHWVKEDILSHLLIIGRMCKRKERPLFPINFDLYRKLTPPVFGGEMFEVLFNSDIVLNIHADSSPEYASNMRLYEATGVGSCLLTDNKKNMKDLFTPGKEVVTYDSAQDCIDKAIWLMQHPIERNQIAEAGKKRCLQCHTYDNRAVEFDQIIKRVGQCRR